MLYRLSQEQLGKSRFPLGEYQKSEIRELAESWGFVNARQKDSQDICFVPDGDYAKVIETLTGKEYPEGDFVLKDGTPLGKHRGIIRYTRGQRRGLGIAYSEPLYVLRVDAAENRVVLGSNSDLFSKNLTAGDFIWTCGIVPEKPINCKAKIRYKHKEQPCTASVLPNGNVSVVFDEPQRAITPGQACVLYRDDEVLGGGTILPDQNRDC